MTLLTWLTLIYAVVLVLALAVTLVTICVYLWRIGAALGEARSALEAVARQTEPLERHVAVLGEPVEATRAGLAEAASRLAAADERLADISERLGVGTLAARRR
jgi:hypothetical protein